MKKYSLYEYMMYGLMFALYIYVDMFIINVPPTLKRSMYDYKAGLNALKTNACGHSAWSKLPRSILAVGRLV